MIEDEVWASVGPEQTRAAKQAIVVLAESGVLKRQQMLEMQRLINGDANQPPDELANDILRVRADTRGLILLHEYGRQLTQELKQEE